MNKYRCQSVGCWNYVPAPEWKAGDGLCRDHRHSGLHNTGLEGLMQWASPKRTSSSKVSQPSSVG